MKKYCILALALALCGAFLVGCGCSNSAANTTVPTTIALPTRETTAPTTAATTEATTMPTTEAATNPTDINGDISETAGENGIVEDSTDNATGGEGMTGKSRSGHTMNPLG